MGYEYYDFRGKYLVSSVVYQAADCDKLQNWQPSIFLITMSPAIYIDLQYLITCHVTR